MLKEFAESDDDDWGDLAAQLSPRKIKKSKKKSDVEEIEEWEQSRRRPGKSNRSRSNSTANKKEDSRVHRASDAAPVQLELQEDEDWGDLMEQLNKKSGLGSKTETNSYRKQDEEDDWSDLAAQLSPRKNAKKPILDFAENDEDWGDIGEELKSKDAGSKSSKKKPGLGKLDKFAESEDEDWGDLAEQLSPRGGQRPSSREKPPIKLGVEEDDEDWGDMATQSTSLSTSSSRSHRLPEGTEDLGDLAGEDGEVDLATKLALTRKARLEGANQIAESADSGGENDPFDDDPFGDDFEWSDNESGTNTLPRSGIDRVTDQFYRHGSRSY